MAPQQDWWNIRRGPVRLITRSMIKPPRAVIGINGIILDINFLSQNKQTAVPMKDVFDVIINDNSFLNILVLCQVKFDS